MLTVDAGCRLFTNGYLIRPRFHLLDHCQARKALNRRGKRDGHGHGADMDRSQEQTTPDRSFGHSAFFYAAISPRAAAAARRFVGCWAACCVVFNGKATMIGIRLLASHGPYQRSGYLFVVGLTTITFASIFFTLKAISLLIRNYT
jgi:hypothetical protein